MDSLEIYSIAFDLHNIVNILVMHNIFIVTQFEAILIRTTFTAAKLLGKPVLDLAFFSTIATDS